MQVISHDAEYRMDPFKWTQEDLPKYAPRFLEGSAAYIHFIAATLRDKVQKDQDISILRKMLQPRKETVQKCYDLAQSILYASGGLTPDPIVSKIADQALAELKLVTSYEDVFAESEKDLPSIRFYERLSRHCFESAIVCSIFAACLGTQFAFFRSKLIGVGGWLIPSIVLISSGLEAFFLQRQCRERVDSLISKIVDLRSGCRF